MLSYFLSSPNCTPVIKIHDIGFVRGILFDKTAQGTRDFFFNKRLVLDFDRNDLSARFEHKIDLSMSMRVVLPDWRGPMIMLISFWERWLAKSENSFLLIMVIC